MDELKRLFGNQLHENILMKEITTVGIGGPADWFLTVTSTEQLKQAIQICQQNNIAYLLIGSGSNLLVSDQGIPKLVIQDKSSMIKPLATSLEVSSGTLLQELVEYSINQGLAGVQRMTGIPGTVGGAIFGNAGAYGQTISDHLAEVVAFDGTNEIVLNKDQVGFSYRDSGFKTNHLTILKANFLFPQADINSLRQEANGTLSKRLQKYPPGLHCPGSFFKNLLIEQITPEILNKLPDIKDTYGKIPAGVILEKLGAKGDQMGHIKIASYHANLFLNLGNGSAADFWSLAKKWHDKAKETLGLELEPEVQLVNLQPFD